MLGRPDEGWYYQCSNKLALLGKFFSSSGFVALVLHVIELTLYHVADPISIYSTPGSSHLES